MKVYLHPDDEVEFLHGPVRSLLTDALSAQWCDRFFFVRFADPQPHVRLRFFGLPSRLVSDLLPSLCSWANTLVGRGLCSSFSFDTYDREVERYGGPSAIDVAESIFCADSVAVLQYHAILLANTESVDQEELAVASVDTLLGGLGLTTSDRLTWLRSLVSWGASVGAVFRSRRATLEALLLQLRTDDGSDSSRLLHILRSARESLRSYGIILRGLHQSNEMSQPYNRVIGSLVHMHCNRFLGTDLDSEQRVLALLLRTYESLSARGLLGSE